MTRLQGAPEAAGHTDSPSRAFGTHVEGLRSGKRGLEARTFRAHAHTRLSPGPPEACASLARLLPRPLRAAGVPQSRDPRRRPRPPSEGAWATRARDHGAARLPEETGTSPALHSLSNRPAPLSPGAAGHDGSVVTGAGSARGGGEAGTTIPTRPRPQPPRSASLHVGAPETRGSAG